MRTARHKKGWTQSQLAEALRVESQTVSNLETGRTKTLKLSKMAALADVFGWERDQFLTAVMFLESGRSKHDPAAVNHAFWGPELFDLRQKLLWMTTRLSKEVGKTSKEVQRLRRALDAVDMARSMMEDKWAALVNQEHWDAAAKYLYRPGNSDFRDRAAYEKSVRNFDTAISAPPGQGTPAAPGSSRRSSPPGHGQAGSSSTPDPKRPGELPRR